MYPMSSTSAQNKNLHEFSNYKIMFTRTYAHSIPSPHLYTSSVNPVLRYNIITIIMPTFLRPFIKIPLYLARKRVSSGRGWK